METTGYMQPTSQPVKLWSNKAEQDKYDKHAGKRLDMGEFDHDVVVGL